MQCLFRALQPVRIDGEVVTGVFEAEVTEVLDALADNGLIEPVFAPVEPTTQPVWEMDYLPA